MNNLQNFIPIVNFLGQAIGPQCEVMLYDLSSPDYSVVAIANAHMNNEIGRSRSALILETIKSNSSKESCFFTTCINNGSTCRSSIFFIKERNKTIGALSISMDISTVIEIRRLLDVLINCDALSFTKKSTGILAETKLFNVDSSMKIIDQVFNKFDVSPDRMSLDEKIKVIQHASKNGLFLLKGGVSALAKRMQVSESTIYRYLNKIREENRGIT